MKNIKLKKRPGRNKPWEIKWTAPDGKSHSRFFKTEAERNQFAREAKEKSERYGSSLYEVDLEEWKRLKAAEEKLGDHNLEEAVDYFLENHRSLEPVSVQEVVTGFLDMRRAEGVSKDYMRHIELETQRFAASFAGCSLGSITVDDVSTWLAELPFKTETRLNHRKTVHALFEFAVQRGCLDKNIVKQTPRPKVTRPEPPIYKVDEAAAIMQVAKEKDPRFCSTLALTLFAGMRGSTACLIVRDEIRLSDQRIIVPGIKMKMKKRVVLEHLPQNIWPWLEFDAKADYGMGSRSYYARRHDILLMAGVKPQKNGFRHSFVSYHMAAYGNVGKTAAIIGHRRSLNILYENYYQAVTKSEGEAYFSILPSPVVVTI